MARKKDLKDLNRLISMANKRLRRMEKKGYKTPAYKSAMKSGGKFHNKRGASFNDKQKEYHRVKNFLGMKTSTITGSKKVVKNMLSTTGLDDILSDAGIMTTEVGDVMNEGSMKSLRITNTFFDLASMVDEYLKSAHKTVSSGEIWRSIHDTYLSGYSDDGFGEDPEEIVGKVVKQLHAQYLQRTGHSGRKRNYNTFLE